MTAEHIHDALTLLPADLIAEADKKRCQTPRVIPWTRYAAMAACFVLVLSSGLFCMKLFTPKGATETAAVSQEEAAPMMQESGHFKRADTAAEMEAAEEPAAPAEDELCGLPAIPASGESAAQDMTANTTSGDSANAILYEGISQIRYVEAMPGASTTACFVGNPVPEIFRSPADLEAYRDKPIQRFDPGHLLENCTDYDEGWFADHDLLLISLCSVPNGEVPEVTSVYEQDDQWYFCFAGYLESTEPRRREWHILIETEKNMISGADNVMVIFE